MLLATSHKTASNCALNTSTGYDAIVVYVVAMQRSALQLAQATSLSLSHMAKSMQPCQRL